VNNAGAQKPLQQELDLKPPQVEQRTSSQVEEGRIESSDESEARGQRDIEVGVKRG